jgi:EmrB/QacA subfamily drug resistance transporter
MVGEKYAREQYFAFARAHRRTMGTARIKTREVIFSAMILATFMVSVEATIVATAMPTIVADLGGLRFFSWVFGAYLLTQAVTIPIYGRLADFFGRKTLLIIGIAIFLTGSVLSGFAHNMFELILYRALQGIGAGGVQPVAVTIVGDLYTGHERARVQAFLSTTWAFSAVIGPLLGAFLVQHVGWPVIFWINVPVGIGCVAIVVRALHENVARVAHRIDYLGSLLLALGVGTLMYVLVMVGNMPGAVAGVLGGAAFVVLAWLIVHERRAPEPMMPLGLYRIRIIALANSGNFAIGAVMMGVSAFLPTYVQGAMGRSPVVAGAVLGVVFIGWTCGSISGARLMVRTSYRTTAISGSIPVVIGTLVLAAMHPGVTILWPIAGVFFLGVGFGTVNSVFVIATQAAVGWEMRGAATASNIFLRQLGQAIGATTFGAIFNLGIYARIPDAGNVVSRLLDPNRSGALSPAEIARDANAIGLSLHNVYVIIAGLAFVVLGLVLAIPPQLRPDHAKPAVEAQGVRPARTERVQHET